MYIIIRNIFHRIDFSEQWLKLIRHIPKRKSMFVRVDGYSALQCFWDAILLEYRQF